MPTLQEILAAKRAAASASVSPSSVSPTPIIEKKVEEKKEETKQPIEQTPVSPVIAFEETKAVVPEKKKSFAEMMAEKKALAAAASSVVSPITSPVISDSLKKEPPKEEEKKESANAVSSESKESAEASDAERSYYQDIKPKIDSLVSLSDDDLRGAMKSLKDALMKNPAATSLMLDTEIGEMVKALRRMTGEALVAATTKEKKPKKDKQIDLSDPSVMQAVLDEL